MTKMPDDVSIEKLGLSARVENRLRAAGVGTLFGIAQKKESELCEIPGFGRKSLREVREVLSFHGIDFGQAPAMVAEKSREELAVSLRMQGKVFQEIGDVLGVCRQRARQIVRRSERKLAGIAEREGR